MPAPGRLRAAAVPQLQLRLLRSFCLNGGSVIGGGGQLVELGFILASFGSWHGIFLLICSGFYKENIA